jgi:transcriptional antiterminator RfaH
MDGAHGRFGDRQPGQPIYGSAARWYAVKTHPKKEELAKLHLERQKFETFFPNIREPQKRGHKLVDVTKPFFPGYLFVRLRLAHERWRSVNSTIGVTRLVQFGDFPAPAPEGLVEDLIERSAEGSGIAFEDPLAPGDRVKIMGGPFDRFTGVFQGAGPDQRVILLLELLSREVRVSVPRSLVQAAKD